MDRCQSRGGPVPGIPLFAGKVTSQRRFTLTDHVILDSGVAVLTYTATES
jgi:hypothetical protein